MLDGIACDLDGVLAETHGPLIARLNKRFGVDLHPNDLTEWDWEDVYCPRFGIDRAELEAEISRAYDYGGILMDPPVYVGHLRTVSVLAGMAEKFEVVTARRDLPWLRKATRDWLDFYGIPYTRITHAKDKAAYCRGAGLSWLIDDSPGQAQSCAAAGVRVALLDKPYNRRVPDGLNLTRVDHFAEVPALIRERGATGTA
jgi:uncharacterized HAD superfamily protein